MSLAVIYSRANVGIEAQAVEVEVDISNGMPCFSIVGLAEMAVKESKDRVRSAIINSQFDFPIKRITVNLAPADLPKEGGRYDLAIAIGILAATQQIPKNDLMHYEIAGELALSGEIRPFKGALPMVLAAHAAQRAVILPVQNANESAFIAEAEIYCGSHLLAVCQHLKKIATLAQPKPDASNREAHIYPDLSEVCGQHKGKRALEIAASGGHSLLLIGPPGTGKTMLANRLAGLLPDLNSAEANEVATIHSLVKNTQTPAWSQRPFRAPHHSASHVALVGGGKNPKPGEISLAHHGILFLDEFPEFSRVGLEALREPLEAGSVKIARANYHVEYPAKFQLIAAMNPCPCGYAHDTQHDRCRCTPEQVQRYQNRLSGPLLDRIDLQAETASVPAKLLHKKSDNRETSATVKARVLRVQNKQLQRSQKLNAHLSNKELEVVCKLSTDSKLFMENSLEEMCLSARAYHRILKVARTIADLENHDTVDTMHLQEALMFKPIFLTR